MQTSDTSVAVADAFDDDTYDRFRASVRERFARTAPRANAVFATSVIGLFQVYLDALPDEVRQHHNCNTCRRFIETYGQLVLIDENGATHSLLWDEFSTPQPYFAAVRAMRLAVESARVTGVFLAETTTWGIAETGDWTHLAVDATDFQQFINRSSVLSPGQAMAAKREDFHTLRRALSEFNADTLAQAVLLLRQDALYRSEKVLGMAEWLLQLKEGIADKPHGVVHNLLWRVVATAPAGFCTPRSSMIGTLLEDLVSGKSLEAVKASFAAKMRPDQYQRPQAAPKAGNIAQAERMVEQMGIVPALSRRYARLDEIQAVWHPAPPADEKPATGGVFGHLVPKGKEKATAAGPATTTMTWEKFARTVLPDALSIECHIPTQGAFYAFATASDPDAAPILQWDREGQRNPFSVYTYVRGSLARDWNLSSDTWAPVNALTLRPHQWFSDEFKHQQKDAFAIIDQCLDVRGGSSLCLFPEILRSELHPVRATIEAYSNRGKMEGKEDASACGLRVIGARLRVTSKAGVAIYEIDRWD